MVPSSKWQGHSPFKAEILGSSPVGITVAIVQWLVRRVVVPHMRVLFPLVTPRVSSESANATDCKSVLFGGNGLDTHLAH